jgi:hypothetical protein
MATQKKSDNTTTASAPPEALAEGIKFTTGGSKGGSDCPPPRCRLGDDIIDVRLSAPSTAGATDVELNSVIRYQLESTSFPLYQEFMNALMTNLDKAPGGMAGVARQLREALDHDRELDDRADAQRTHSIAPPLTKIQGTLAYEVLRLATEAFMLTRCGPACIDFRNAADFKDFIDEEGNRIDTGALGTEDYAAEVLAYVQQFLNSESSAATPYLQLIVKQLSLLPNKGDPLTRLYASRYECPMMIELIWSYWHEEAMLSQTMNAIAIRFQNRRSRAGNDPLANLEIDPLRPLNNVLWGWIQSEYKRLSVQRRAYEYDHHYGVTLMGKAVPPLLSADSRSNFLESFHSLLWEAHDYFEQSADTTRIPDGFPLLNALRHLHLILAEGAHNQYGDLPWTSRVEMLIEQWLLARPEMREFLRGRAMVPYQQAWMGQVDSMKKLQGWTDVTVTHFHELATCGEAILLSVRQGPWASANNQVNAKAWANYWRPEIQRYMYGYKAVTGTDLTMKPQNNTMPAQLLSARLSRQQTAARR